MVYCCFQATAENASNCSILMMFGVNCTPHRQTTGPCTYVSYFNNAQLQSSINSAVDGNGWLATLGMQLHWNNCYNGEISWFSVSNLWSFLYQKLPLFCKKKKINYIIIHKLEHCISGRYCNVWSIQTSFLPCSNHGSFLFVMIFLVYMYI